MSDARRLEGAVRSAIAQGVLPADATVPRHDERPWPVVLLTAFGAWLAAIPLFAVVGLLFSGLLKSGAGAYVLGAAVIGGAVVALRRARLPLFVEQMVTPTLIVGAGLLAWGAYRDAPPAAASVVLALVALAVAFAIPRPWLRVVLGAAAATLLVLAWLPWRGSWSAHALVRFWAAWHLDLVVWLLAGAVARTALADGARAAVAAALESVRAGWLLATLVGLAWWSGMTFLVGATLSGPLADMTARLEGPAAGSATMSALRVASLLLAVGAAAWAARSWPTLRSPVAAGVALVLVALAWFLPALGATLLALSACATAKRWRLAATAAVAAAWIVGGFYYQLAWPLATKAIVLVAAGVALGALAWLSSRAGADAAASSRAAATATALRWNLGGGRSLPVDRLGIVATALFVVIAANVAIWQKEDVIAHGQPVFVRLAPVDPRSLMQGDYMRLDFGLPGDVLADLGGLLDRRRPQVVARRDARNVATVLRVHKGEPLAADELRIELTPAHGDWILVSDAWSFAEGEADRWARARYGEFRVDASGRALLVGLRGENLEAL